MWAQLLQYRPFTTDLEQQKCHEEEFIITSLQTGLDSDLPWFEDQILTSETLALAANAYSWLLHLSIGWDSIVTGSTVSSFESFASVSSRGYGSFGGGFCGGCGFSGGSCGHIGDGDGKYDHCGGTNHIEAYCWVKYGKPYCVHQVIEMLHNHNLLLHHLSMQLLIVVLVMQSLLVLVS